MRFHDCQKFFEISNPDLVEFHLSYQDMLLKPDKFLNQEYACGFVVHAPELFENSELLDLASSSSSYRKNSILNMQRVIDLTLDLKRFFPNTKRPLIVTNVGGFSMDQNFTNHEVKKGYEIFAKSLSELNTEGVEIIPQTMAPYPWHFGGQRYQNLFVHPEEISEWCNKLDMRMCFDISHSIHETRSQYGSNNSLLMAHASHKVPGVEFSTGSLGHGLPVSVGIALSNKIKNNERAKNHWN